MNWKQLLKPVWRKIAIFIILFLLTNYFINGIRNPFLAFNLTYGPVDRLGYPFIFIYEISSSFERPLEIPTVIRYFPIGTIILQENTVHILGLDIFLLLIDIVFWYLFSCLIIWIYDKFRKPKKK